MSANTWPLESPMLPPLVLRPPHGPRLVRLLVMLLAIIFYIPPAGWSLVTNGPEGELAGAALEIFRNGGWRASGDVALLQGPLALWLSRSSLGFLGTGEFAVRLPAALAAVALFWLVLRMGEQLGTLWRGSLAALLLLCSPGMLTFGRLLSPAPLTAALVTACIYSLQRSVQDRPERRRWLVLAWIAWGFATLAGGWRAGAVPAGAVLLLCLAYPEARLRFRGLVSWQGGAIFALTGSVMVAAGFAPWDRLASPDLTLGLGTLVWTQVLLLFPWSLLLLPALGALALRLFRLRRPAWEEALPLAWLAAALAGALWHPSFFSAFLCWPAFAVWAAAPLNTLRRTPFLYGCLAAALAAGAGIYVTQHLRQLLPVFFPARAETLAAIPPFFWEAVTPLATLALLAFVLLAAAAFWSEFFQNRRFALLAFVAAMIPAGFALADIGAKFAPYFSDASLAYCIESCGSRPIYIDGGPRAASSLLFYLSEDARRQLRPAPADLPAHWSSPALLIAPRGRLPAWKQTLAGRFNSGCETGEHLALSAVP